MIAHAWAHDVAEILSPYTNRPWLIGLSGGCDSVVLYELLCQLFPSQKRIVLHANHQIQKQSQEWVMLSRDLAIKHGDCFITKDLLLKNHSEQEARTARYEFFKEVAANYTEPILLLGHHLDDADETALWRFLRGAPLGGILGISSCHKVDNLFILRPLMNVSRKQIEAYAQEKHLAWVTDPSNAENTYTRNFLRNAIIAPLKDRSLQNIAQSRQRLNDDYEALIAHQNIYLKDPWRLELKKYPLTEITHQRSLMQNWLSIHQQPQPSYEAITEFLRQCLSFPTKNPQLHLPDGQILASYQGQIWRDSPLWWSMPHPEPQIVTESSGGWGLVRFSGVSNPVLLRRLRKNERLPGMQNAQDYWHHIQLPPWRRPFYPLVEQDGKAIQYGNVWHQNQKLLTIDFDWRELRDLSLNS